MMKTSHCSEFAKSMINRRKEYFNLALYACLVIMFYTTVIMFFISITVVISIDVIVFMKLFFECVLFSYLSSLRKLPFTFE